MPEQAPHLADRSAHLPLSVAGQQLGAGRLPWGALMHAAARAGPPDEGEKSQSDTSKRIVMFPKLIPPALHSHLDEFAQPGNDGLVFAGSAGQPLRRGNFRRRVWLPALQAAGLPTVHFHDLRHTGNNLTANAGANLRELITRMGHSSTRAAIIYLHATDERQRASPTLSTPSPGPS